MIISSPNSHNSFGKPSYYDNTIVLWKSHVIWCWFSQNISKSTGSRRWIAGLICVSQTDFKNKWENELTPTTNRFPMATRDKEWSYKEVKNAVVNSQLMDAPELHSGIVEPESLNTNTRTFSKKVEGTRHIWLQLKKKYAHNGCREKTAINATDNINQKDGAWFLSKWESPAPNWKE